MELRPYRPADCPALLELFRQSVHRAAAGEYTPAQLAAWAPEALDAAAWHARLAAHVTLLAYRAGRLAGFGDVDPADGYLDHLYVHPDCLRQGVATALCDALEAAVPGPRIRTDASRTARPFFLRRGYRVLRAQQVLRRGVWLENFAMEKAFIR